MNTSKKSIKKYVIIAGIVLLFAGAAIDGNNSVGFGMVLFAIGIVTIIVGLFLKSQKQINREIANFEKLDFNITKKISNLLLLDEERRKICIPKKFSKNKIDASDILNYDDIQSYELLEDGNSVSKGGVGRAIVGGLAFGGVGAIVGGVTGHKNKATCSRLQIKITTKDINNPVKYIDCIHGEVLKDSIVYKASYETAQIILSTLDIITNS